MLSMHALSVQDAMGGSQCKWAATITCLFRDYRYNYVKINLV